MEGSGEPGVVTPGRVPTAVGEPGTGDGAAGCIVWGAALAT